MKITRISPEKSLRGVLKSTTPQLRIRFSDNNVSINMRLVHKMGLEAGAPIFFAFGSAGESSQPILLIAKTTDVDTDALKFGKHESGKSAQMSHKGFVTEILRAYGLARTQCKGLLFTLNTNKPTIEDDGVIYFNLGKPEQYKGGGKS